VFSYIGLHVTRLCIIYSRLITIGTIFNVSNKDTVKISIIKKIVHSTILLKLKVA